MDGRRRWLDILKLGSDGKNYFAFVTNLAPCSGVRLHLWPEKSKMASDTSPSKGVVEVTSKMVEIPAGPAPIQIEPGSQTEQPPPSAVLQLGPEDMRGFHFLTISVSPRPVFFSLSIGQGVLILVVIILHDTQKPSWLELLSEPGQESRT
ncbi:hypothetical protein IFM89_009107 [Coptis chinensis]|uniref:Uncharacterized protein n=1 Tax=Coptis chinensis TaxID=261450 RepID=A0A835HTU6_9MAGN|nr:hypothetical protein IFM89_009107 [Coptis chinensis]